jgi:hypothetical protein
MDGTEIRRYAPWSLAGVILMGLLLFVVWRFGQASSPAQALASKASRVDLVGRMQVALAAGAEEEKSAVLAATDAESEAHAARARASAADLERERLELQRLMTSAGTPGERALLERLTADLAKLRAGEEEVLRLAVKNTNLKAAALAAGPAAQALADLDVALALVTERRAAGPQGAQAQRLADQVRVGTLRVQVLLAPHIAEERDERMDALEATMKGELDRVGAAVTALSALVGPAEAAPIQAGLERYLVLQRQALALSRENTNVKSLTLSLGQKRVAQAVCQDALAALQAAILEEPIPGVAYGRGAPTR